MKDRQGVMRGKCNECNECTEYVAPSTGARCDYCDHVPTKHVQIIKLGPCKKCDGECEEYISDEKTSYTDCQYCGCKAADHKGAEKLRKTPAKATAVPSPQYSSSGATPTSSMSSSTILPNSHCKYPGCSRPCFKESNRKAHEFCGKTHAQNYKQHVQAKSSVNPQDLMSLSSGLMKSPPSYFSDDNS